MPGINRDIAQHYIPTKEGCKPVKQKTEKAQTRMGPVGKRRH